MPYDHFRPSTQPARAIYDAFQNEALKREGRAFEEWREQENISVHMAAVMAARTLGIKEPTMDDVVSAERFACGHSDYGAQWAYRLADVMTSQD